MNEPTMNEPIWIGDIVRHAQFGIGMVQAIKPTTDTPKGYRYKIKFGANVYELNRAEITLYKRATMNAAK